MLSHKFGKSMMCVGLPSRLCKLKPGNQHPVFSTVNHCDLYLRGYYNSKTILTKHMEYIVGLSTYYHLIQYPQQQQN